MCKVIDIQVNSGEQQLLTFRGYFAYSWILWMRHFDLIINLSGGVHSTVSIVIIQSSTSYLYNFLIGRGKQHFYSETIAPVPSVCAINIQVIRKTTMNF